MNDYFEVNYIQNLPDVGNIFDLKFISNPLPLKTLKVANNLLTGGKTGTKPKVLLSIERTGENSQLFEPIPADMIYLACKFLIFFPKY